MSPNWNATAGFLGQTLRFHVVRLGRAESDQRDKRELWNRLQLVSFLQDLLDNSVDVFSVAGGGGSAGAGLIRRTVGDVG